MSSPELHHPTAVGERVLGPDLARGFMLMFIALANSHYFLRGSSTLGGYPQDGSQIDSIATWVLATFVDGRAFPMFGLLFGYGVAQIVRRQEALGPKAVRRLLWRRAAFLIVVGFVHAVLLYAGDILGAYGVLLLAGAWMVRWKDRWLIAMAIVFFAIALTPSADSGTLITDPPDASMLPPDLQTMFRERAAASAYVSLLGPLGFVCPFAIGLWMGRRRILEQPELHRTLLSFVAGFGIAAAVLGAQPISLMLAGWIDKPNQDTLELIGPLHDATGILGGFGYAALISLIAIRLQRRRGPVVDAIGAVGQRSMTCYLTQSVFWMVVFTPFLLNLSDTFTVATTALFAVSVWLVTVALADWMRRTGRRGPFEVLVRRVTYGKN